MEEKSSGKKKKARTSNPLAEASVRSAAVASHLTDDIIVEILSRLPAKSVHRFKCVSPSWRDLIADPAHRKKLPHTLVGFFYNTYARVDPRFHNFHFANVSVCTAPSVDPSLPFLPHDKYLYVAQLDTCNGLLLCLGYIAPSSLSPDDVVESHYIVCNPATERSVHLPHQPGDTFGTFARLAFDPAVSSHFHVLQFDDTDEEGYTIGVTIYSSQTGAWKHRKGRFLEKISLYSGITSVFFHGMLHLLGWLGPMKIAMDVVLVSVDMEGQVWKTIRVPSSGLSFDTIGLSQGCFHFATIPITCVEKSKKKKKEDTSLATKRAEVWYIKDYDSREWVLKHSFSKDELRTKTGVEYKVAAFHPDCDTIFLDSCDVDTLASYDMRHRKFRHILTLEKNKAALFVPYVPLFSDSLAGADGQ